MDSGSAPRRDCPIRFHPGPGSSLQELPPWPSLATSEMSMAEHALLGGGTRSLLLVGGWRSKGCFIVENCGEL